MILFLSEIEDAKDGNIFILKHKDLFQKLSNKYASILLNS